MIANKTIKNRILYFLEVLLQINHKKDELSYLIMIFNQMFFNTSIIFLLCLEFFGRIFYSCFSDFDFFGLEKNYMLVVEPIPTSSTLCSTLILT